MRHEPLNKRNEILFNAGMGYSGIWAPINGVSERDKEFIKFFDKVVDKVEARLAEEKKGDYRITIKRRTTESREEDLRLLYDYQDDSIYKTDIIYIFGRLCWGNYYGQKGRFLEKVKIIMESGDSIFRELIAGAVTLGFSEENIQNLQGVEKIKGVKYKMTSMNLDDGQQVFTKADAKKIGQVKTVGELLGSTDNPPKKRGRPKKSQGQEGGAS